MEGDPIERQVSRRTALGAGVRLALLGGAGLLLTGCAGSSRSSAYRSVAPAGPDAPDLADGRRRRRLTLDPPPREARAWERPTGAATPQVIARRQWTTRGPIASRMNPPLRGVHRITIHHDGMRPVSLRGPRDVADRIAQIHSSHLERGWGDIGYHYIVDPLGQIWEGRSTRHQGAHVRGQNEHNLGILVLGNFERQSPTDAQVRALDAFAVAQLRAHRLPPSRLHTHRELAPTLCPGRALQAYIDHSRRGAGALARA